MSDPTPLTPVTIQDRIRMALELLQGATGEDLATLAAALYTQTNPRYPWLLSINSRLEELKEQVDKLQAGVGAEPYSSLELGTVRGYLAALVSAQGQLVTGRPPASYSGTIGSGGDVLAYGRKYAIFPNAIEGVTISAGGRDLTAAWNGWFAYIQTTDPAPQVNGVADIPNYWIPLSGTGKINFSVAGQYTISVYLRRPSVNPTGLNTILITMENTGTFYSYDFSGLSFATTSNELGSTTNYTTSPIPAFFSASAMWQFRRVSGTGTPTCRYKINQGDNWAEASPSPSDAWCLMPPYPFNYLLAPSGTGIEVALQATYGIQAVITRWNNGFTYWSFDLSNVPWLTTSFNPIGDSQYTSSPIPSYFSASAAWKFRRTAGGRPVCRWKINVGDGWNDAGPTPDDAWCLMPARPYNYMIAPAGTVIEVALQ